ncbi:efflux RND transporter periplasmic adaptor subunit [Roseateles asaccharophilus]|uniref:RND family efflux transporter MFP subunit n=1 Tax=Roseateles asaccharophilus TaxID=582607 RepID=A0ABU2A3T3_9BURK|nr:efflux RND transporter periplasmic adaptor subunit [Roseateles asaccharophilus]MDR7331847.1 RND family efflux transporter MFP subunit [Roseateles asaccharophilus]
MDKKNKLAIAAVLVIAVVLGAFILRSGKQAAGGHDHDAEQGHGDHGHEHEKPAAKSDDHKDGHDHKDGDHDHDKPAAPAAASAPAAHAEPAPRASFNDEQLRHNGIKLATAGPQRIAGTLELMGEVKLNQDRSVVVTPRLAGVVQAVRVSAGDRVQRGQVLAVVTSPALADQRAEALAAEKRLALARQTHDREKKLWEDKISAQQDYLAARQALQEAEITVERERQKLAALGASGGSGTQGLAQLEIRAPIAGVVVDKKISVGEALKEDAAIFQLADLSSVWVELVVPAQDLARLQPGAHTRVKATAFDAEAPGKLSYVGALVGEQSRSATARVVLANPQGVWRPGLPVSVTLTHGEVDVPVAVTLDAVQTLEGRSVVFVRRAQQFETVVVKTGRADDKHIEIVQGLPAGERYAAKNSFIVKAELGKSEAAHEH